MSWIAAGEAARQLGVSRATLYAYVSRGLVRSEPRAGTRERRYCAEDVTALLRRRDGRRDPAAATREALHFGAPILDTRLAAIAGGRLHYRGRDALVLARTRPLESVAALLWTGDADAPLPDALPLGPLREPKRTASLPPIEAFQMALAAESARDAAGWDLAPDGLRRTGSRILRLLAAVAGGTRPSLRPVAETLAAALVPGARDARPLLDTTLVLWADHELNVSTFTARCVASALASPYQAVIAGLAALRGARHGGATEQVEALLASVPAPQAARAVLEGRLRRREGLPGFGHPLYPGGDPRAALLVDVLREARPRAAVWPVADALAAAARELTGLAPNVDLATTLLVRALGLPPERVLALVAIGRSVGWIAHVLEQVEDGRLIRPRARYVGEPPEDGA